MKEGITRESCCCQSRTDCRFCLLLRNGCRCCLNRRYRPNCPCRSLPRLFRSFLPGNRICRPFLRLPSPRPCCSCRIASKTRIHSLTVLYFTYFFVLVPVEGVDQFALAAVPQLQLFFASVGSRQEHVLPDIQRISRYFGSEYGPHYALGADVPDVNLS